MAQKWIQILVILVFYQKTSAAVDNVVVKEKQQFEIHCKPINTGTMIIWFRLPDTSGMEFIASFSINGMIKAPTVIPSTFSIKKIEQHVLTLQSFNKTRDSGMYSCASLVNGKELHFGKVTRLVGVEVAVAPLTTTKPNLCTTATACVCNSNSNKQEETSPSMICNPIILGPLAGSCGLLLLLLITTILYCNHIRTRRCPHHYKRQPRTTAPGKQMKTIRHV